MEHQADEEDDEQMMGVPEHLKVRPADDLHGRSDDEDEGQRDGHARQPGDGGEHDNGRALHQSTDICYFTAISGVFSPISQCWDVGITVPELSLH